MPPASCRRLLFVPVLLLLLLCSCEGVDALANHGALDVHTHMSETVFLDPVPPSARTVYLGVRNTSDYPDIDFRQALAAALSSRGYTVVADPEAAHYMLQANVLQAGKIKPQDVNGLVSASFGQPLLAGAAAGALTGGFTGSSGAGLGVGLGVLAASALVNYAYQDVTYAVTVDIQLSERPLHGAKVYQSTRTHHGHHNASYAAAVTEATPETFGASSATTNNDTDRYQSVDETSDFKKYNVRDIAYADKVNLQMSEAVPTLMQHLASSFANLFE